MSTHYQGTPAEESALDVYIKLMRAAEVVNLRINRHLKSSQLTISQFGVLEAIYHLGPMHQNQLAAKILKTGGNLTLVIDNLVKRGLVRREQDPQDRRCFSIHLTETGRDLVRDLFARHVPVVVETIGVLSLEEQAQLAALCRKLGLAQPVSEL
jgi:MarR family transcriptional regulator, 2-MHQ and catechol-resistance regulon repressor